MREKSGKQRQKENLIQKSIGKYSNMNITVGTHKYNNVLHKVLLDININKIHL